MKGHGGVQQPVGALPFDLEIDAEVGRQEKIGLAGFHGNTNRGPVAVQIPGIGMHVVFGHEASGIVLLEPILVPVWVFLAWRNTSDYVAPQWWTLVGGGLILTGLLLRYIGARRDR